MLKDLTSFAKAAMLGSILSRLEIEFPKEMLPWQHTGDMSLATPGVEEEAYNLPILF